MIYKYKGILKVALESLETLIKGSALASTFSYLIWHDGCNVTDKIQCNDLCEQPCKDILIVNLNRELTSEEKIILDNLIVQA